LTNNVALAVYIVAAFSLLKLSIHENMDSEIT